MEVKEAKQALKFAIDNIASKKSELDASKNDRDKAFEKYCQAKAEQNENTDDLHFFKTFLEEAQENVDYAPRITLKDV